MPGIDFRKVRALVSMRDVLELLGFVPRSTAGVQRRGVCPLHRSASSTSRVFSVNLAKNAFRCFHCGAAGNQLDLWAAASKQSLHEAAQDLCRRLAQPIPWIQPGTEKRNP
jgi:DNA primase